MGFSYPKEMSMRTMPPEVKKILTPGNFCRSLGRSLSIRASEESLRSVGSTRRQRIHPMWGPVFCDQRADTVPVGIPKFT